MTIEAQDQRYTNAVTADAIAAAAAKLTEHGFAVEILEDAAEARVRVRELIPPGSSVLTGASETLRLSGIEADINNGDRYDAVKPRLYAMDRAREMDDIRRLMSTPDVSIGSVNAVTEAGSLVVASASGSQLPGYAGGAGHAIWVVGAQKIVADLAAALRRVEEYCLPLENERALKVYGQPSAVNRLLILNGEPYPGRGTVLLLREAIGF